MRTKSASLFGAPEDGGLKVTSLNSKNLALLGKWWWQFCDEKNQLWQRVINAIYGHNDGLRVNHRAVHRTPWGSIINAGPAIAESGVDFKNSFSRILGKGDGIRFWDEKWDAAIH